MIHMILVIALVIIPSAMTTTTLDMIDSSETSISAEDPPDHLRHDT